jgi:23S rRNA (uracil1939-C5)-methyltransferase
MDDRSDKPRTLLVPAGVSGGELLRGRTAPPPDFPPVDCVHADRCGGCTILSLPYGDQLSLKRGRVVHAMARYPSLELAYTDAVLPAERITQYRTRAKLMVAPGGRIGLFAKGGGHQVVDIEHCQVLSPVIAKVADILRGYVRRDEAEGGPLAPSAPEHEGMLRALDLREIAGTPAGVLVTLVAVRPQHDELRAKLAARAKALFEAHPEILGVAVNWHDGDSPQVLGPSTECLAGAAALKDRIGDVEHVATYGSFVQAHRGQAARIHKMLIEAFGLGAIDNDTDGPRILDLYGGSGAIALALARAGARVHMVESFAPAVAQATSAAAEFGLHLTAESGDVASMLQRLVQRKEVFAGAVVNPPRRGMSPDARRLLAEVAPQIVAYVSCDPETLARDLDHFSRLGYFGASVRPLDMIPLTDEVETLVVLTRASAPAPRVLHETDALVAVERGAHDVIEGDATSLVARVRRMPGLSEAELVYKTDGGASGLCVFARNAELAKHWDPAFRRARSVFLVGVRGIAPSKGAIQRDLRDQGHVYSARTRYRRLAISSGHSILRVIPDEARPHQARRHLAAVGHPVLGDTRYGHPPTNRFFEEKNALDRPFLHVVRVEVDAPNGEKLLLECPLAGDLRSVLERTGGPGTLRFLDQKHALGSGASVAPPSPGQSLTPPVDYGLERGSAIELDTAPHSMRPPIMTDDDDANGRDGA